MPVYRKGRSRWRVVIIHRGKRRDWIVEGTHAEAEAFEARERVKIEAGDPVLVRTVPGFSSFCVDRYKPHAELRLSPGWWTKQSYILATLIQFFGDDKISDIDGPAIEEYARKRLRDGLSPTSVNNELRVLRRVLGYAREIGVPAQPDKVRPLKQRGSVRVHAWSSEERERLLAACAELEPEILPLVAFLANTGCRKGEALALTWDHVDVPRRMVMIWPSAEWQPKNGKPREIPISDDLLPWLDGERRSDRWVFPVRHGKRKGERFAYWPQRQFDLARKSAVPAAQRQIHERDHEGAIAACAACAPHALKGGPHTLRHTYATHFLATCPDLYLLARILGHSDVAVTRLYSHLLPDHLARARNAVSVASPIGPAALEARIRWGRRI